MTTHAALSSLCLSALLAASTAFAQAPDAAVVATEVAVKRQAATLQARQLLGDARVSEARREILAASQHYNKALELVNGIGEQAEPERQAAIDGLSRTTLVLADQAMKAGRFDEAKLHIDRVLKVDPTSKTARDMRVQNDRLTEENKDKMPHPETLKILEKTEIDRIEVNRLVQDGKLFYETGRLKEAEAVLRKAIRLDPDNKGASYYLDLLNARKYAAEVRLREVNEKQLLMQIEQEWEGDVTRAQLEVPNPYARTNLVHTSSQRQLLYYKLRNIRLNEWGPIDNLPLSEVMRQISDEARKRDLVPQGTGKAAGINFIISSKADSAGGAAAGVDPAGLPVADPAGADLNAVTLRLGTKLVDLNIEEILNIIEKIADTKIKYSVEDWGIMISPKAAEPTPLHTRYFHVDPNTFQQGLQNVTAFDFGASQGGGGGGGGRGGGGRGGGGRGGGRGGGGNFGGGGFGGGQGGQGQGQQGGASYAAVSIAPGGAQRGGQQQQAARPGGAPGAPGAGAAAGGGGGLAFLTEVTQSATVIPVVQGFFTSAGVNLTDPGKAVFYNDRLGVLMVRATLADLDMIEKAMQILNMAPPQMTIRAKFMEVNQDDSRALGFDWYLGNTKIGSGGKVVGQGGTAPTLQGNNDPFSSGGGPFPNAFVPLAPQGTDQFITGGLRNSAPTLATVTGILTDPQFRMVVRALEQRGAADLLSAPEVTTMSGRQAQIKVVDIRYIVTELDTDQTAAGQGQTAVGTAAGGGGGIGSLIVPIAEPFELGPVLDVVPYVNADGFTIQLTLLPTLKEFLGYDDPGQFVAQVQGASASGGAQQALTEPTPLPKFRLRQVATTAMVWDGQTVMLGGLISETVTKQKDKVPVLGDLPFFGRFFRSESNISSKKNLVIFVTPRLIDPAGNPLHSDEEMPFAQHSVPAARSVPQP